MKELRKKIEIRKDEWEGGGKKWGEKKGGLEKKREIEGWVKNVGK